MENIQDFTKTEIQLTGNTDDHLVAVIPIVQETMELGKQTIETGRVRISKKVIEEQTEVNIPLTTEAYEITRVPVNQVVTTQPAAMRQEGDTTIYSVIKEVLVVEKRYEIVEEVHITKKTTEKNETQQVTLRHEEMQVERTPVTTQEGPASYQ